MVVRHIPAHERQRIAREWLMRQQGGRTSIDVDELAFDEQRAFISDPATFVAACCSRRAGKSRAVAFAMIQACLDEDGVECLYLGLSQKAAGRYMWRMVMQVIDEQSILVKVDEKEQVITFEETGSTIYIAGATDLRTAKKWLGSSYYRVFLDEVQDIRDDVLRTIVSTLLGPTLADKAGSKITITGTPGPSPIGMFFDAVNGKDDREWSVHKWTCWDNPYLENLETIYAEELKRRGMGEDAPYIRSQYHGEWAFDADIHVYRFGPSNLYDGVLPGEGPWRYVMGVDTGYQDADAIVVLAFSDSDPNCYMVEELVTTHQGWQGLYDQVIAVKERYTPESIVIDAKSGGKKAIDDMTSRYGVYMMPAEQRNKRTFIGYVNDALRTGKLFLIEGSKVVEDMHHLVWDQRIPTNWEIGKGYHSDACDAMLYAFREARHFLYEEPVLPPRRGTDEWYQQEERLMREEKIMNEAARGSWVDRALGRRGSDA